MMKNNFSLGSTILFIKKLWCSIVKLRKEKGDSEQASDSSNCMNYKDFIIKLYPADLYTWIKIGIWATFTTELSVCTKHEQESFSFKHVITKCYVQVNNTNQRTEIT
jgi:hypothetical protein